MKYQDTISNVKQIISEYDYALTLRQIFYRLVSDYGLTNNKTTYAGLSKQLVKAREDHDIPIDAIEDRSRGTIKSGDDDDGTPNEYYDHILGYLKNDFSRLYSMSRWETQDYYIEVWVEKDALSQVIANISQEYSVLTAPSRGYSSFSYIHDAVERFQRYDYHKGLVLHFSDHDPSGLDMTRDLQLRLRSYGANVEVKRIALTHEQVQQYKLSPNPTKSADPRSKDYVEMYGNECWELDALPPDILQKLVKDNIKEYINQGKWDEREQKIADNKEIIQKKVDELFSKLDGGA